MQFDVGRTLISVNVSREDTLMMEVEQRLMRKEGFAIATLNLDHLVKLRSDLTFREAYGRHDLVTADGNPIVWLARLAGQPLELLPGADLIRPVLQIAARLKVPVAFVGSTEAALSAAASTLTAEIAGLDVRACVAPAMGFDPSSPEAGQLLDDIAAQGIGLVLVALGAPKQERLAALGRTRQPSLCFLSIGAGLDFIAGLQRRAPPLARRLALEWLWRVSLSPRRLSRRYVNCTLILPNLLGQALSQRRVRSNPMRLADVSTADRPEVAGNDVGPRNAQQFDGVRFRGQHNRSPVND